MVGPANAVAANAVTVIDLKENVRTGHVVIAQGRKQPMANDQTVTAQMANDRQIAEVNSRVVNSRVVKNVEAMEKAVIVVRILRAAVRVAGEVNHGLKASVHE